MNSHTIMNDEEIREMLDYLGMADQWLRLVEYEDENDEIFSEWVSGLSAKRRVEVAKLLDRADRTGNMPCSVAYLEFLNS